MRNAIKYNKKASSANLGMPITGTKIKFNTHKDEKAGEILVRSDCIFADGYFRDIDL